MLVTSYYNIYNKTDRFLEYIDLFSDLALSGIPIIVFTEPELVENFKIFPSNVKIIGIPLSEFKLYSIGMKYTGELPNSRNHAKDTQEFLSLMNTKIEFILKAAEIFTDATFIWIDFGILKIVKNRTQFINTLKKINDTTINKIIIPGCWNKNHPFSVENVNWRFCGGLFIIHRNFVYDFYQHSKNVLTDFCSQPIYKLTWETNIWYIIEMCAMGNEILWYYADHNDSILMNINSIINR